MQKILVEVWNSKITLMQASKLPVVIVTALNALSTPVYVVRCLDETTVEMYHTDDIRRVMAAQEFRQMECVVSTHHIADMEGITVTEPFTHFSL